MKFYDIFTLAILFASFIIMVMTLIISSFNNYVISVATNNYGECWIEIIVLTGVTPLVIWRSIVMLKRLI